MLVLILKVVTIIEVIEIGKAVIKDSIRNYKYNCYKELARSNYRRHKLRIKAKNLIREDRKLLRTS